MEGRRPIHGHSQTHNPGLLCPSLVQTIAQGKKDEGNHAIATAQAVRNCPFLNLTGLLYLIVQPSVLIKIELN